MSNPINSSHPSNYRLQEKIKVRDSLRRGQEPLWNDLYGGLSPQFAKSDSISQIQEESLNQNEPISHLINSSHFNLPILRKALALSVYEVNKLELDSVYEPKNLVNQLDEVLKEIITSTLRVDASCFESLSDQTGISPLVISVIGGALIQPSMVYIASHSSQKYLDAWGLYPCPICGRRPSIVVKSEEEPWRFKCQYCQSEYMMDIFTCPYCNSKGADNKEFLVVGDSHALEIASCSVCQHYYKIINKHKLEKTIPNGMEEIYTEQLDKIAEGKGLTRLDELSP